MAARAELLRRRLKLEPAFSVSYRSTACIAWAKGLDEGST